MIHPSHRRCPPDEARTVLPGWPNDQAESKVLFPSTKSDVLFRVGRQRSHFPNRLQSSSHKGVLSMEVRGAQNMKLEMSKRS